MVAERRSGDTPVAEVMTPRAETVPRRHDGRRGPAADARGRVPPLPDRDAGGRVVIGVVTDTDLMGIGRDTPFALKSAIERAARSRGGRGRDRRAPARRSSTLVDASADPVDVGHIIAFAIDAATRRLLELGMAEHGEPPFPWAWLALGSAARQEQAIRTDQDHALRSRATPMPPTRRWRRSPSSSPPGLEAAGISRCNGDVMATNARAPPPAAGLGRALRLLDERAESPRRASSCRSSSTSAGSPGRSRPRRRWTRSWRRP